MRQFLDILNALLALTLVGFAVWAWPHLPSEVPVHFGPDGTADRWAATTVVSWFQLPVVALALWGSVLGVRRWIVRRPDRIKMPAGGTLADHPAALHPPVMEHMRTFMALVGTELLLIFGLILAGSYRTAQGGDAAGTMLAVMAVAILSGPILLVVFLVGLQRITARHRG